MNASLQALRSIPELKTALTSHTANSTTSSAGDARLTTQLRSLFNGMDQTTEAIPPYMFLQTLRTIAPQFAEQSQHGGYAQQGALRSSCLFIPSDSFSFVANLVCWLVGETFLVCGG
jgi:ubiquitin carboxyl-terminal hydrolase 14